MSEGNIREALQYAVSLSRKQEVLHEVKGETFYDADKGTLRKLKPIQYASALEVNTLTGLVGFLKEKFDLATIPNGGGQTADSY